MNELSDQIRKFALLNFNLSNKINQITFPHAFVILKMFEKKRNQWKQRSKTLNH